MEHERGREEARDVRRELAGAAAVEHGVALEQERVLVRLAVAEHDVAELLHHRLCRAVHQRQPAHVVGPLVPVLHHKAVERVSVHAHHNKAVSQQRVVLLKLFHVLVLALGHLFLPPCQSVSVCVISTRAVLSFLNLLVFSRFAFSFLE